jgi:hypothetical protein
MDFVIQHMVYDLVVVHIVEVVVEADYEVVVVVVVNYISVFFKL